MDLDELIGEFAREMGTDAAEPDADGLYSIAADGRELMVGASPADGALILWAEVGETPPEGREAFYRMLLEAMYADRQTAGARFSLEQETGRIILHREDSAAPEDLADFKMRLNAFADLLDVWRRRIADFRANDDVRTPSGGEGPDALVLTDFIRV